VRAVDKPLTKDELIKDYGDVFKGLGNLLNTINADGPNEKFITAVIKC
jgi:hypothetical protein